MHGKEKSIVMQAYFYETDMLKEINRMVLRRGRGSY